MAAKPSSIQIGIAMPTLPHHAIHIGRRSVAGGGEPLSVRSPIDGAALAEFPAATVGDLRGLTAIEAGRV